MRRLLGICAVFIAVSLAAPTTPTSATELPPDWVVATLTLTKPTTEVSIRVEADVVRSGDDPTALGLGIADDLRDDPYVWVLDVGGDISATVNTYGALGERSLEVTERPLIGTSSSASMGFGYLGFDFQPGDSFSILVFAAGGTLTPLTATLTAADEVLNGSLEIGTGSEMVLIPGTTTSGAVVAVDRFSAANVARSTTPSRGIVGAMAVEGMGGSCEAGACVWRAEAPDGTVSTRSASTRESRTADRGRLPAPPVSGRGPSLVAWPRRRCSRRTRQSVTTGPGSRNRGVPCRSRGGDSVHAVVKALCLVVVGDEQRSMHRRLP